MSIKCLPFPCAGKLPFDLNGVYFVPTSADVDERGLAVSGNSYCAFHGWQQTSQGNLVGGFIRTPVR